MVVAFFLDISIFLSSSYVPKVHPYHWTFLEGHLSCPHACLLILILSEKDNPLGLYSSTLSVRDPPSCGLFNHLLLLKRIHIINWAQGPVYKFGPLSPHKSLLTLFKLVFLANLRNCLILNSKEVEKDTIMDLCM